jgi:hypothetical protein
LTLEEAYACAEVSFVASFSTGIGGTIVDGDGRPVPDLELYLRPAFRPDPYAGGVYMETTDARGRFEFRNVGPDKYVVGVNIMQGPTSHRPFGVAYARNGRGEREISLKPGEQISLLPFTVRRLSGVRQTGAVRRADGYPVAGVILAPTAIGEAGPVDHAAVEARTDEEGNFAMDLFRGARYRLTVGDRRSPVLTLDIVAGDEPLVITLPPQR